MKMLWWMLGGAAVGAGAALLYAPMTGRRARALIRDKFTKYSNDLSDAASAKATHTKNVAQGWRHKVSQTVAEANELVHEMAGAHTDGAGTAQA
jgi:gas vesicle protein